MVAKIIINPYSGRWKAKKNIELVTNALDMEGVLFETVLTEGKHHATELAARAARDGFDPIVAVGGDGTIHEVMIGLMEAAGDGEPATFGFFPQGSANDLADNLGLSQDIQDSARRIAKAVVKRIDLIRVNDSFFINNAALGLEPTITTIQEKIPFIPGSLRYIIATVAGVLQNPQWSARLEWDDGEYEGPVTLVSVGNCARTGGVFYVVPHADPYDGKLTFLFGSVKTRLGIFRVLPKIMKAEEGNIATDPAITEIHATRLKVSFTSPTPSHADGELFPPTLTEFLYEVLPGKLKILVD